LEKGLDSHVWNSKQLETLFGKIYTTDPQIIKTKIDRFQKLSQKFVDSFGNADWHLFSTPGRTEIGGNHTDHNLGRVLAASVNMDSIAVAAPAAHDAVTLYSEGYDDAFVVDLTDLDHSSEEEGTTTSLIRGIAARLKQLGYQIRGFNAVMTSEVLPGSGLSSSASVEVLIGQIFSSLHNDNKISPEELAMIGQYAENNFFGKPCGLMDQVACAVGGIVTIDFKNPQKPIIKKVDFDFSSQSHSLVVVDTGGNHADLTDDYASIPKEMKKVAAYFDAAVCREITYQQVIESLPALRRKVGDRAVLRAMHFLVENDRVVEQVTALENDDFDAFLKLVNQSGNSSNRWLQNMYTNKAVQEQGVNIALAVTENFLRGKKAAFRVHGGGFAGTIQVFVPNEVLDEYVELVQSILNKDAIHILSIRPLGSIYINSLLK